MGFTKFAESFRCLTKNFPFLPCFFQESRFKGQPRQNASLGRAAFLMGSFDLKIPIIFVIVGELKSR